MRVESGAKISALILSFAETLLWYGYLLLMVGVSLLSARYDSQIWLRYAGVYYFFCGGYLFLLLLGAKFNALALHYARLPIMILALMLAWLLVQALLPVSNHLITERLFSGAKPEWFDPDLVLSIEPQTTRWLFFSNAFIFSWFLLTLAIVTTRRRVKELLVVIMLVGLLHALIGLYAKYGNLILVDKAALDGHFSVARGLFINRNHYASFISITLIGAVTYFLKGLMQEWQQRRPLLAALDLLLSPKVIYICATVIGLIALILSESRAGLFGVVSAFFLVVLSLSLFDKRVVNKRAIFVIVSLALIGLGWWFGNGILTRLSTEGFSIGERLIQWKITWSAILDAPILGYGAGSYSTVFQIYREHAELRQVVFDQSHNEYLQLWLEQGMVGLSLFGAFVVVVIATSVKMYRTSTSNLVAALMLSALIVLLAALAQSIVDFNLQIINIRCFFFVIIALMYASKSLLRRNSKSNIK